VKLIAGLGNPGRRYAGTRHNLGYAVIEELARRWSVDVSRYEAKFEGQLGEAQVAGERVWLLMPTTYMNLSGRSVGAVARFYKLEPAEILVICDDLDLPVGALRLRPHGSAGGQRGLTDVLRNLSTDEVPRMRLGIGKVHRSATVEYVTSRFEPDEVPLAEQAVRTAAEAADCWVRRGVEAAMNEYNRKPSREGEAS
jgi:PTH1 family peptidyl-tRNA hydrolase